MGVAGESTLALSYSAVPHKGTRDVTRLLFGFGGRFQLHPPWSLSATMSAAQASPTSLPPARPKCFPAQGPRTTRAYGFILDEKCINHWAAFFYKEAFGVDPSTMSPEEASKTIRRMFGVALMAIPNYIFCKVPSLPRLQRCMILMNCVTGKWLFALRDDSSLEARTAPIYPDDIEEVKKLLEIDTDPQWYHVSV